MNIITFLSVSGVSLTLTALATHIANNYIAHESDDSAQRIEAAPLTKNNSIGEQAVLTIAHRHSSSNAE